MFPALYFPGSYFSTSYFPTDPVAGPTSPPAPTLGRDWRALEVIAEALAGTSEFAAVVIGTPADRAGLGTDSLPAAILTPIEWVEREDSAPGARIRHTTFTLTLVVRSEDGAARVFELDRLGAVAQGAVEGSDLGGGYLPACARLRRGRFELAAPPPEGRVVLTGEFAAPIPAT